MKKTLLIWVALTTLFSSLAQAECLVIQHRLTVETRCNLGDLQEAEQRQLIYEFIDRVRLEVSTMHFPETADASTDRILDEVQNNLDPLITATNKYSKDYRESRGGILRDLIPSGLFFEIGVNGSVNLGAGVGSSLLITFAVVPTRVKIIDKETGVETDRTEWQQDSGGLLQLGGGIGGGGGVGVRGGLGMIWGDLPHPWDVISAGLAEGVSLDAQVMGGAGVTAIDTKNKETGLNNITVFAHLDGGPDAKVELHGSAFYMLDRTQVAKLLHVDQLENIFGKATDGSDQK